MLLHGQLNVPRSQAYFFRPWLSGLYHGRVVMAFTPGWPALLAASQAVFRSMFVAVGLAAAAAIVATYLFARELFDDDTSTFIAAAIVLVSPFFFVLASTYLNYTVAIALEFLFAFTLFRGTRTRSGPVDRFRRARRRDVPHSTVRHPALLDPTRGVRRHETARTAAAKLRFAATWLVLGALPLVVIMLAYNAAVSRSASPSPRRLRATTRAASSSAFVRSPPTRRRTTSPCRTRSVRCRRTFSRSGPGSAPPSPRSPRRSTGSFACTRGADRLRSCCSAWSSCSRSVTCSGGRAR